MGIYESATVGMVLAPGYRLLPRRVFSVVHLWQKACGLVVCTQHWMVLSARVDMQPSQNKPDVCAPPRRTHPHQENSPPSHIPPPESERHSKVEMFRKQHLNMTTMSSASEEWTEFDNENLPTPRAPLSSDHTGHLISSARESSVSAHLQRCKQTPKRFPHLWNMQPYEWYHHATLISLVSFQLFGF